MTSSIRAFWRRLEGNIHPDDEPVFSDHRHTFNLDFPPPAFIGDIDNAPVIVLMANGGYDPAKTKNEFLTDTDRVEHIDWIKGLRADPPKRLSSYYTQHSLFPRIRSGEVVIVNAIAYRSPKITDEPDNKKIGRKLHSWTAHREWLFNEIVPAIRRNERFVVAHRPGLWDINRYTESGILFSTNPASPYLSADISAQMENWLHKWRSLEK